MDIKAPVSLCGEPWLKKYLEEFDLTMEDMKTSPCRQFFRFGLNKRLESKVMIELSVVTRHRDGKVDILNLMVYALNEDVTFLFGKEMLKGWRSKLDTNMGILEITKD